MKTTWIALSAVLALCSTLSAQPAPSPLRPGSLRASHQRPSTRVMDPAARSNFLARAGGLIQSKATGPSIMLLNAQTRVAADALGAVTDQMQKIMRLPIALKAKPSAEPVTEALQTLADTNTAAVIVIADSPGYPSLLVAPENRWALVNVAALSGAGITAATLAERTQKEVWRAFGYLMGAAHSNFEQCLLKTVLTPADLDALKPTTLCPEPFGKIMAHAQKLGMKQQRITTYRKAVEEGWAPTPTNDLQRAIWNELKK